MARPIAAQTNPPRRMLMKRGRSAVISDPAETEFAAMFVPSCAREKAKAMKKTPALAPEPPSERKFDKISSGPQIVSP